MNSAAIDIAPIDVVGIGNAIVDVIAHAEEPFVTAQGFAKGSMNLIDAVRGAYPTLSHRYYRLKAKWFGVAQLESWDRNAPLPDQDDRIIPWPEAQQ